MEDMVDAEISKNITTPRFLSSGLVDNQKSENVCPGLRKVVSQMDGLEVVSMDNLKGIRVTLILQTPVSEIIIEKSLRWNFKIHP